MKNASILAAAFLCASLSACRRNGIPLYRDATQPVEARVRDLLSRMTVAEKIKQLDMYHGEEVAVMQGHDATAFDSAACARSLDSTGAGSVHDFYPLSPAIANRVQDYAIRHTRLGIPVLFIEEGLHGYNGKGSTFFPVPLALSTAWDPGLVHRVGHRIAGEARGHGIDMILGPVLGLARDPRWGRVEETYGEDPFLNATNGVAMVTGLQGDTLDAPDAVIAEPKHFAMHSIPEGGSNTSPVSVGEREARSDFLYVFSRAVREGGARGIMAAYSEYDGIPCIDNHWLLTDVLRKEWGFRGFVLSDLGAIKMTLADHHVAMDTGDALAQALEAGVNMQFYDFAHATFTRALREDLDSGRLREGTLDSAVADILRVKFELGLFDHPYTDSASALTPGSGDSLALTAAREGICLLKNEGRLLPLGGRHLSVAVIGSLATSNYLGDYSAEGTGIPILDALKGMAGDSLDIRYAQGYSQDTSLAAQRPLLSEAAALARRSDVSVVVLGETEAVDGEGKDRAGLGLDAAQQRLLQTVSASGKPVVAVLANGRPLTIGWAAAHVPAILETWYDGVEGGRAIAETLLGRSNPSGKLPITFPRSVGQLPFYYDHKPTSWHRYVDEASSPLFAFGHGLSYTAFRYSGLSLAPEAISDTGTTQVKLSVTNTGSRPGTEVVQLYVRDLEASVTTPVKALKGFRRITLAPGQSGEVCFPLGFDALSVWNREMKRVVEPGRFLIMVGSASDDIRLSDTLRVAGARSL